MRRRGRGGRAAILGWISATQLRYFRLRATWEFRFDCPNRPRVDFLFAAPVFPVRSPPYRGTPNIFNGVSLRYLNAQLYILNVGTTVRLSRLMLVSYRCVIVRCINLGAQFGANIGTYETRRCKTSLVLRKYTPPCDFANNLDRANVHLNFGLIICNSHMYNRAAAAAFR